MKLSKEDKKSIPIWVKFYNIPLEYWDGDGLSRIASAVGVPLFMDQLTSLGSRISFARVCVDIPTDFVFPDSFVITSGDVSINIRVEYQGVPSRCEHCNVFGHETKNCLSAQVTKLIKLQKNNEDMVESDAGWTKVKDKGKRKAGEQPTSGHTDPTEVTSSSAEIRDDLEADNVAFIAAKTTDHVAAFHSGVVEIAKIINLATEEFIKSIEHAEKEEVCAASSEMQEKKMDSGINAGCSFFWWDKVADFIVGVPSRLAAIRIVILFMFVGVDSI
ncbi:uncharacterized protein LOC114299541 [Camellia sinensis]|uniref:uncharacterized protein LOC114299541 n=1 Tax=Camellia sinensis TaxID=4442 RepID=UPI001035970C|nr:uncharacterized protein LOC114299541 [Camellia sinensis]